MSETTFLVTTPDAKMDPFPDGARLLRKHTSTMATTRQDSIKGILEVAGREKGVDVLATGKGRGNCVADREAVTSRHQELSRLRRRCDGAAVLTAPAQPVEAPKYSGAAGAHDVPRGMLRLSHV
jgi:hypothetical protein